MDKQDSEKRTIKMTEKAVEDHKARKSQARKHKFSQLTSLTKHIEQLMDDDSNVDAVKNKLRVDFTGLQQELLDLNSDLKKLMDEEDFMLDQRDWFDPKQKVMDDFFWRCEEWMKDVLKRAVQAEECDRLLTAADSRSTSTKVRNRRESKSASQCGSSLSSSSTVRLKAEMERASLMAKAAALQEKLIIEQEEADWQAEKRCREAQLQAEERQREAEFEAKQKRIEAAIKAKKEMHAIQTALAESDAKMEVIKKYESTREDYSIDKADDEDGKMDTKPSLSRPTLPTPKQNAPPATNLFATYAPKTDIKEPQGPVLDELCQAISQQANVTEYLVKSHKASLLPDLSIATFKGDPMEYKSFIRAIEHGIEGRTGDNRDRLQFLLQYTSGQPHELVKSCIHMEPSAGYTKAKQMLKEFFGDDFKIAEAYINEALDWPTIKPEDGVALQSFALFLTGCTNTMTDINYMEDLDNTANIKALANKLPYKLKESWRKSACDLQERTKKRVKFKDFVDFVNHQVKYLLHPLYGNLKETTINTKDPVRQKPKPQFSETFKSRKVFTTVVVPPKIENGKQTSKLQPVSVDGFSKPCVYCNGEQHSLAVCRKFKNKQHKDKIGFLRSKGLCFACLKHGHMSGSCKQKLQCEECSRPHPTPLHFTNKDSREEMAKDNCEQQSVSSALVQTAETFGVTGAGKEDCVLSIVPVCIKSQKGTKTVTTYAFLDPGSSATFATESLIHQLNMNGRNVSISLRTMGNESIVTTRIVTGLEISSLDSNQFVELSEVYSQKDIPVTKDNIPRQEDIDSWPHLKEVRIPTIQAEVGLLIGANVSKAMEPLQVVNSVDNGPYAVRTILGWIVNGPLRGGSDTMETNTLTGITANRISVAKLEELWQLQFKQDFPDAGQEEDIEMSKDDHQFISMVSQSATLKDSHYNVCLPVKKKNVCMPNNRAVAEQRALNLQKRFLKDVKFYGEYVAFMDDLLKKGYAVKLESDECKPVDGLTWYLPHHGVRHPTKKKLRVVFDCGASFGGTSLNQQLLQGPDLTSSLVGVLMRFRQETVAVMADVEAMFHQVRVSNEDTDLLRFLWWPGGNYEMDLVEHKMLVHIFGATSSPSVATFALQQCATDFADEFGQETAKTVKKNFYVDDCLKSTYDEDTAVILCTELRSMLAKGGFRLTKWSSNSRKLLNSIPEKERAQGFQDLDLDEDNLPMERALGIQWCAESDQFRFKINLKDRPLTRRGLLSLVSSIFDPLGFLAPVILSAKRILQDLCRRKYSWDEELPDTVVKSWNKWISSLPQLEKFGVDRCVKSKQFGSPVFAQLHHFADASEDAYGTTSYLLLCFAAGEVQSTLILAKARVAPLKSPTIPRMELTAATVAIKMDKLLRKELELELQESIFWTDSTAVLKYLNSESTRFKTFVANRVSAILDHSRTSQWRYINTTLNPADLVSRGQTVEAFLKNESWLSGPSFLLSSQDQWPKNPDPGMLDIDDPEVKRVTQVHVIQVQELMDQWMNHYSSWTALKRAVAWFLKLKDLLKELKEKRKELNAFDGESRMIEFKKAVKGKYLTCDDLTNAETNIVKYCQKQSFKEDLVMLEEYQRVKKSSSLFKLNPVLKDGVMRVGGRLSRAAMPDDSKQQAILPKDSHITKLVLRHVHDITAHAGRNHMLAHLRQRFWIPGASGAIRRFLSKCVICKRLHGATGKQLMADLPACRVLPDDPPFTRVGIDYFGPFLVKRGRVQVKRYGVIFTCLAIRAVHLEVASSLDTNACLHAIRRFIARRGQVREMYSDNGTNFRSADSEMRKLIKQWNTNKIEKHLLQRGVQWHFNPPAGSHHGGSWERLIRSVRKILNITVKEQLLDEEDLHTLLCEAEAVINSRPITKASSDLNDLEALTPNHLLLLKVKPELPPGIFHKDDQYVKRRWRQVQYLADIFWKRWCKEYLTQLQERQRWFSPKRNFAVGDVVLIVDDTSPRNSWPLGRIVETFPDRNGLVRQVKVKTKTNELCRPITKLCLLQESEDN